VASPKFVTLLFTVALSADQSLRDLAVRHGSVSNGITFEFEAASIGQLISQSQLVLLGRIISEWSHLSADETYVLTDYDIAPTRILRQTFPVNTGRPGQSQAAKIVVRREGGAITEGNNRIATVVNVYPEEEALRVSDEVILFLTRSRQGDTFDLVYGPFGCFKIVSGNVLE
jgi:hypothetical protein